jgi:hypothetical protein
MIAISIEFMRVLAVLPMFQKGGVLLATDASLSTRPIMEGALT